MTSTISRVVSKESMLFYALKEHGIKDVQQKAPLSWTDHNLHDPGITILEALCYVITEIGGQLNFSVADLLSHPQSLLQAPINFPSAAKMLPGGPVSLMDFRKIILDLEEVRNAYLEITKESKISVFYNTDLQELTYIPGPEPLPIKWGGLYAIQLEFEDDELNSNVLSGTITVPMGMTTNDVDIIISFRHWDEMPEPWFHNISVTNVVLEDSIVILDELEYEDYYSEWKVTFSDGSSVTDVPVWVKLVDPLNPTDPMIPNLLTALETAFTSTAPDSPFIRYKVRLMAIKTITDKVKSQFHLHRNVGEDLSFLAAMRVQEISVHAQVEIEPAADPTEVTAQIFFAIELFFSPRPVFRSLEDIVKDPDFNVDEIFVGPLLNSGFIAEQDLKTLSRGNVIYVSDLIHKVLDLADTIAVRDFSLSSYFNNFQEIRGERNCLKIDASIRSRPKLDISRSELVLTRNGVAITVDPLLVNARLSVLRAEASAGLSSLVQDFDFPVGNVLNVDPYRSVQYELPAIYGTGSSGLPVSSSPERWAQLKQLQGYLFVFDQLLANTFSQLSNVWDLFSVHQKNSKTYYYETLYHVPGAENLLGHLGYPVSWSEFISQISNEYIKVLEDAGEPGETFFERRNIILDHLLARFSEERQRYSATLSNLPGNFIKEITTREKEEFLEHYPTLSRERAQGYNYLLTDAGLPDVWDSMNTGGYERMVCHKLGFRTSRKRTLFHNLSDNFEFFDVNIPPVVRNYKLKDNLGNDLMISRNTFPDDVAATEAIRVFLQVGLYQENYEIIRLPGGDFSFQIAYGSLDIVYNGTTALEQKTDAENVIRAVIDILSERYSLEGVHFVEHILLRPRTKGASAADSDKLFVLLKVGSTTLTDPYSHVVTAVLPSGKQRDFSVANVVAVPAVQGHRLRDPEYLLFVKQTILREAAAHLLVNIFLLDVDTDAGITPADRPSLQNFEQKFQAWREALADPAATPTVKATAQQELVTVLESIYGV